MYSAVAGILSFMLLNTNDNIYLPIAIAISLMIILMVDSDYDKSYSSRESAKNVINAYKDEKIPKSYLEV